MKRISTLLASLMLFGMAGTISAAETADLAHIGENIRSGKIDVGHNYSMDFKKGRFHIIHADKMLLDCTTCHIGQKYKEGVMNFSKYKPYPLRAKGNFEKSVCLGCHQDGGIAASWYTPSSTQVDLQLKKTK